MKKIFVTIASTLLAALALTACCGVRAPLSEPSEDATPAPVTTNKPKPTPKPYDAFYDEFCDMDLDSIVAEAMAEGYPEEKSFECDPSLINASDVFGLACFLSKDDERTAAEVIATGVNVDTAADIAGGASIVNESMYAPADAIIDYNHPDRLNEIAARGRHILVFGRLVGLDEVDIYVNEGGSGCKRVTEVRIPAGIGTLSGGVFSECEKLADAYIPASVECLNWGWEGSEPFYGCPITLTIHCAQGSTADIMAQRMRFKVAYD